MSQMPMEEENRVDIAYFESNLTELAEMVTQQMSAYPDLQKEKKQRCAELIKNIEHLRFLEKIAEDIKIDNIKINGVKVAQKNRIAELAKKIEEERQILNKLQELLKQEEDETTKIVLAYGDRMQKRTQVLRDISKYYNKDLVLKETKKIEAYIKVLEKERGLARAIVLKLQQKYEEITPSVPDEILTILGKPVIDDRVDKLLKQCNTAVAELNAIKEERARKEQEALKKRQAAEELRRKHILLLERFSRFQLFLFY